jgi:cellobiose phosphorylase
MGNSDRAWQLLRMINPVQHGSSAEGMQRYKVEPYVVTADVYAVSPHIGRGGWSWYTGSSGWMYRLIVESLLGITLAPGKLTLAPLLPPEWSEFKLRYRCGTSHYLIHVTQVAPGEQGLTVDGVAQDGNSIALVDDGREHAVALRVLRPAPLIA